MGRPQEISRDRLLDHAQSIITQSSPTTLSFGILAAVAGIPKSSVQAIFRSKQELLDALLERTISAERMRFVEGAGSDASIETRVRTHIEITASENTETQTRIAGLLAGIAGAGDRSEVATRWCAERIGDLSANTPENGRLRLAFLASEGLFFLRHVLQIPVSDALWREIFRDIKTMIDEVDTPGQ